MGRGVLTKPLPRDLKKSFARDGISFFEISDIGKYDTDRIATLDESGLLVPMRNRESEKNGIAGGKKLPFIQREYRAKASTSLHLPDPLFVRRVDIHGEFHRESDFKVDRRHRGRVLAHEHTDGPQRRDRAGLVRVGRVPESTSSSSPGRRAHVRDSWTFDGLSANLVSVRECGGPRRAGPLRILLALRAINSGCRRRPRNRRRHRHGRHGCRHLRLHSRHPRRFEARGAWLH